MLLEIKNSERRNLGSNGAVKLYYADTYVGGLLWQSAILATAVSDLITDITFCAHHADLHCMRVTCVSHARSVRRVCAFVASCATLYFV